MIPWHAGKSYLESVCARYRIVFGKTVTDKFGAARMGTIRYGEAADFFEVAFNLPSIFRYPYQPPLTETEVSPKADQLDAFIAEFFKDYQNADDACRTIQAAIREFLRKLASNEKGFVAIHLEGPGGIGKTHFVKALSRKFGEIGMSLPTEEVMIRGSDQHPGQLHPRLNALGAAARGAGP